MSSKSEQEVVMCIADKIHPFISSKPSRALVRVNVDGHPQPVKYLYFGNTHRNLEHGGIICLAVCEYDNKFACGIALVPNVIPRSKVYHLFEKPVVRNIAWVRLNQAINNVWDDEVITSTIKMSTVTFPTHAFDMQGQEITTYTKLTAEAIKHKMQFSSLDTKKTIQSLFANDEYILDPSVEDVLSYIITDYGNKHILPDWVCNLGRSGTYEHIDGKLNQAIADLERDAEDMQVMADLKDGIFPMLAPDTSADDFVGTYKERTRVVHATVADVCKVIGYGFNIVDSDGTAPVKQTDIIYALAILSYNNAKQAVAANVLSNWFRSLDDLYDDAQNTLYFAGRALKTRKYDLYKVLEHKDLTPETDEEFFIGSLDDVNDDDSEDKFLDNLPGMGI